MSLAAAAPAQANRIEYQIRDASGVLVAIHVRVNDGDSKRMHWRLEDGTLGLDGMPTRELPLYGSERDLGPNVVLCEGEKAAQALIDVGIAAVGTVCGAAATPSLAVLSELAGKRVWLWPDADDVGRQHMERIAAQLAPIAAGLRWIEPGAERPKGWDAADAIAELGIEAVQQLIQGAPDVEDFETSTVEPQTAGQRLPTPAARLVRISDVQREVMEWEWQHRLPRRKVAIVEGDPGLGKSTLLLDVAARETTGAPMPGTELEREPAGVVMLTAEDGLGDTVRPRLEAAGADLDRVAALTAVLDDSGERMPYLPDDLKHVEQAARDMRARLIIIDPLMAYLSGDVNTYRDQDVRRALAPMAAMAERIGAAVVVIRHLNKSSSASALYRGGGSIGITGAARAVLLVAPDPDDEERRIVAVSKSNLAIIPPALAYRLVPDAQLGCARIEWLGTTDHRAGDLLAMPQTDDERDARSEAIEFLRELLADGRVEAVEARRLAHREGIADRTLDRAKKDAGVMSERDGYGPGSKVYWHIERHGRHTSPPISVASYGDVGDVWGEQPGSIAVEDDYPSSATEID